MSLLSRFAASLDAATPTCLQTLADVRAYAEWQAARRSDEFVPTSDDDADIRTYFIHLRAEGANRVDLKRAVQSLEQFYAWAQRAGMLSPSPFDEYDLDRPFLTRDEIRRRQDILKGSPQEREITRLRALNQLVTQLNQAVDVQTALDAALKTILQVMGLKTAWVFLLNDAGATDLFVASPVGDPALHDFSLAAWVGLPPGLEQRERYFMRCPPDCHCQRLLRGGKIARAVNVVECSRIDDASDTQSDMRGLLFHASAPLLATAHEHPHDGEHQLLGILNVATQEWQFLTTADLQFLTMVAAQLTNALERARLFDAARAHNAYLQRELEMARQVQASLIPRELPSIAGFALAADWRAAREVSGDFYDIFPVAAGQWAFVIADVSDKGAPAALYMAMTRSLIRSYAERDPRPAQLMARVNATLFSHDADNYFVTAFYAVLDPSSRTLTYANAGHNPPLVRRASGELDSLSRTGCALGIVENDAYQQETLHLAPTEALVVYTDGVTEAINRAQDMFSVERLEQVIQSCPADAAQIIARVLDELAAFTEGAPLVDDVTLFALMAQETNSLHE